jgi:hypothetical protein
LYGVLYTGQRLGQCRKRITNDCMEAFEMWLWRRVMKKWTEQKMNEEMLEMVKKKRMLMKTIRERQMNCMGRARIEE